MFREYRNQYRNAYPASILRGPISGLPLISDLRARGWWYVSVRVRCDRMKRATSAIAVPQEYRRAAEAHLVRGHRLSRRIPDHHRLFGSIDAGLCGNSDPTASAAFGGQADSVQAALGAVPRRGRRTLGRTVRKFTRMLQRGANHPPCLLRRRCPQRESTENATSQAEQERERNRCMGHSRLGHRQQHLPAVGQPRYRVSWSKR
jgi:hypothetical protein